MLNGRWWDRVILKFYDETIGEVGRSVGQWVEQVWKGQANRRFKRRHLIKYDQERSTAIFGEQYQGIDSDAQTQRLADIHATIESDFDQLEAATTFRRKVLDVIVLFRLDDLKRASRKVVIFLVGWVKARRLFEWFGLTWFTLIGVSFYTHRSIQICDYLPIGICTQHQVEETVGPEFIAQCEADEVQPEYDPKAPEKIAIIWPNSGIPHYWQLGSDANIVSAIDGVSYGVDQIQLPENLICDQSTFVVFGAVSFGGGIRRNKDLSKSRANAIAMRLERVLNQCSSKNEYKIVLVALYLPKSEIDLNSQRLISIMSLPESRDVRDVIQLNEFKIGQMVIPENYEFLEIASCHVSSSDSCNGLVWRPLKHSIDAHSD